MMGDGLYEPLGQQTAVPHRPFSRARASMGVLAAAVVLVAAGWAWWRVGQRSPPDLAVVAIPPPSPAAPAPAPIPALPQPAAKPAAGSEADSGVKVVRPPGAPSFPGTFIAVPQPDPNALAPAPDPRLAEPSHYGLLPRRGPDGATPAQVYAHPAPTDLPAATPRIALFVGGMGLNPALTTAAAQALPSGVTLGFAPYGGDLGQQVQRARALGHEAVLQVPMESFNAADATGAMPRLLTTASGARATLDDLHWQMARFAGYVGIANFLGAKFTADAGAFTPVLKDVGERGLFFLDDGTAPRNLAATLGPPLGLPVVKADVVIDALADPETIDASLQKLEKLAQEKGSAIGATTGLPTTVDRIAPFANQLASHGIALVPVSALAAHLPTKP